eukprot:gene9506-11182_t
MEFDCGSILVACEADARNENDTLRNESTHVKSFRVNQVQLVQPTHLSTSHKSGIQSIKGLPFGVNDLQIICQRHIDRIDNGVPITVLQTLRSQQRVLATSSLFRYASALHKMQDRLYYGWEGNWTKELEQATADLVKHTNSDVINAVQVVIDALKRGVVFAAVADEIQYLLDQLIKRVHDADSTRSLHAIGQLHGILAFFALFTDAQLLKMRVPEAFVSAFRSFLCAKMNALDKRVLLEDLRLLASSGKTYLTEAARKQHEIPTSLNCMIRCAEACIHSYSAGRDTWVILELHKHITNLSTDSYAGGSPVLPMECINNPARLNACVQKLSEILVSDNIKLGCASGYKLQDDNIPESASIIARLLEVGIIYTTSEKNELDGHLSMERSLLVLNGPSNVIAGGDDKESDSLDVVRYPNNVWVDALAGERVPVCVTAGSIPFTIPPALRKRSKEMHRVFRNNVKLPLSLRLNTNIDLAIQKLRQHHGEDCWATPALQKVWKYMADSSPPQLLVFELWYGEEMIAADFAHPVCNGRSVYVATRFNDRSAQYRNLMPGFMLALVVTKYLQAQGCHVWDLGTASSCPLLRYKLDLTGKPLSRPVAQYELMRAHNNGALVKGIPGHSNNMGSLSAGMLIREVTSVHLLS